MRLNDVVTISDFSMTPEGYMHARARLSRTGIQEYFGFEIGAEDSDRTYRVYRPASEVFDDTALASFLGKPVTDGHPWDGVTASNWRQEAVGIVQNDVRQDGEHVAASLMINDAEIANRIQRTGAVELSCGYDSELVWGPGVTEHGETYDAYQRNIRGNHVAVVEKGRCGASCAVYADSAVGDKAVGAPAIVMLHASADTQRAMRAWAIAQGFDISTSFDGEVQHVEDFGFHATIVATNNDVTIPTGEHDIAPATVRATSLALLGDDKDVPVLSLPADGILGDMRQHFVNTYGADPTFPDFKPHLSLSYAWNGAPAIDGLEVPGFDLVFDRIVVSNMKPKPVTEIFKATDNGSMAIQINDCAGRGRCACTRNNAAKQETDSMSKKQVTIDGKTFDVDPEVATALAAKAEPASTADAKSADTLDAATADKVVAALDKATSAIEAKDGVIAAKDSEIEDLKSKVPTADALDKMAADRATLIGDAKSIADSIDTAGLSDADIRKAAVVAKLGDRATKLDGKSDEYVAAMFDTMLDTAKTEKTDPIADAIGAGVATNAAQAKLSDREVARNAALKRTADAWKGPQASA